MTLAIHRIGTATPRTAINQVEALQLARALLRPTPDQETWLQAIYAGTHIRNRYTVFPEEVARDVIAGTRTSGSVFLPTGEPTDRGPTTAQRMEHYALWAPPLAAAACRAALDGAAVPPADFTHLVTVSCTGFFAPGLDRQLVSDLGLRPTIARTHIGFMGCHGALNGLRVADAFAADPRARVLFCAVELCCLHYHYGYDPARLVTNAIFADGAAAVVGVPEEAAPAGSWRILASGSCYLPESDAAMTWTIGDHGFEMTLDRNVPALITRYLKPWLANWLDEVGVGLQGVRSWGVHPGGPRILEAVEEALGLTPGMATTVSQEVLRKFGNMSSPTVLFILKRLIERQAPRPSLLIAFGPGLVAEAMLVG